MRCTPALTLRLTFAWAAYEATGSLTLYHLPTVGAASRDVAARRRRNKVPSGATQARRYSFSYLSRLGPNIPQCHPLQVRRLAQPYTRRAAQQGGGIDWVQVWMAWCTHELPVPKVWVRGCVAYQLSAWGIAVYSFSFAPYICPRNPSPGVFSRP